MTIRVRIAPSPTGPIHVGNVHTALFNWLWARNKGGKFILRFEDTDQARSRAEWEQVIFDDLKWLGMDWDEGPDIGGPHEPYRQMARLDLYRQYADQLLADGHVYKCYCTPEELDAERKEADAKKIFYKYSRRCLHLTDEERARFEAEGRQPVLRFRVPDNEVVRFNDIVRGPIEFPTHSISDFIIMRSNGIPLYNFAVVIDDVTMNITHIIRGEGHISNTPVQLLIYQALNLPIPEIGHVGHMTNAERGKLSKRKGEAAIRDYREKGILPEALMNFMVLLGWAPPDNMEFLTKEQMIELFRIEDVTPASSVFDTEKLEWMNGNYIRQKDLETFANLSLPFVVDADLTTEAEARQRWDWFKAVLAQVQERVRTLAEVPEQVRYFLQDEITMDEAAAAKFLSAEPTRKFFSAIYAALQALPQWDLEAVEAAIRGCMDELGLKPKESIQPVRVAVTGRTASPGLFETVHLVGRERTLARLKPYLG